MKSYVFGILGVVVTCTLALSFKKQVRKRRLDVIQFDFKKLAEYNRTAKKAVIL